MRLGPMIEHAEFLAKPVAGRRRQDLHDHAILELACIRAFEVVGEATAQLSEGSRTNDPEIPWRNIVGMRNRLIHAYFTIDRDILWRTAIEEVPDRLARLRAIHGPPRP